jgi:hypothetical protein
MKGRREREWSGDGNVAKLGVDGRLDVPNCHFVVKNKNKKGKVGRLYSTYASTIFVRDTRYLSVPDRGSWWTGTWLQFTLKEPSISLIALRLAPRPVYTDGV